MEASLGEAKNYKNNNNFKFGSGFPCYFRI